MSPSVIGGYFVAGFCSNCISVTGRIHRSPCGKPQGTKAIGGASCSYILTVPQTASKYVSCSESVNFHESIMTWDNMTVFSWKLIFEATLVSQGDFFRSDIAIDDVSIVACNSSYVFPDIVNPPSRYPGMQKLSKSRTRLRKFISFIHGFFLTMRQMDAVNPYL